MKYLCMVFIDETKLQALPKEQLEALDRESLAHDDALRKSGHLLAAQALEYARSARTVRRRNGQVSITNGPFAETTEQIGGFILVEAAGLEEAVTLASRIPVLRLGDIEVRPVHELRAAGPAHENGAV